MEDSVTITEAESMVLQKPSNIEEKENQEYVQEGEERVASGFMKQIISNFVSGSGEVEEEDKEARNGALEVAGDSGGENGGGGLINNLISNFFHQGEDGEAERESVKVDEGSQPLKRLKTGEEDGGGGGGGGENGGGMINNLISNMFHQSEGQRENGKNINGEEEKVVETKTRTEANNKTEEVGNGGGGFFPNDAAPTSDEAAILIHSVIHD